MESGSMVLVRILRQQLERCVARQATLAKQQAELELREQELQQLIDQELENR
ncbi:MAG: hypothetical protein [Microvirus sp.]|nr:MAG: hypothetical protein [Microvirus sp.]